MTAPPSAKAETRETLAPLISEYLRVQRSTGHMSRDTARKSGYRLDRLSHSFGARPVSHLTEPAIERWMGELGHLSPTTRRLNLTTVRTFCAWLVRRRHIKDDPTANVRVKTPRRVPRALNPEQVAALMAALPDARARAIVALQVYAGLRCIEVSRLEWGDYDDRALTLFVRGKGGHERVLPVPAALAAALEDYRQAEGLIRGPLIRSSNDPHDGLTPGYISTLVVRWMRDAGIKHRRFDGVAAHSLRHTAASDVLDRSGDLRATQNMLGHADLTTTGLYLRRASLDTLRAAMEGRHYGHGDTPARLSPLPGRPVGDEDSLPSLADFLDAGRTFDELPLGELGCLAQAYTILDRPFRARAALVADFRAGLTSESLAASRAAGIPTAVWRTEWAIEILSDLDLAARVEPVLRSTVPRGHWPPCWGLRPV